MACHKSVDEAPGEGVGTNKARTRRITEGKNAIAYCECAVESISVANRYIFSHRRCLPIIVRYYGWFNFDFYILQIQDCLSVAIGRNFFDRVWIFLMDRGFIFQNPA